MRRFWGLGMKNVKKYYVEKYYNSAVYQELDSNIKIESVSDCNPLSVDEEKGLVGFRFFEVCLNGGDVIPFKNYSGMYYFGKRVSLKDLGSRGSLDVLEKIQFDYLSRLGLDEAIFCENAGKIIKCIDSSDLTIDEVKRNMALANSQAIFVNQRQFAHTVEEVLHERGNDVFTVFSDSIDYLSDSKDVSKDSDYGVIRTCDLYCDKIKLFSVSGIVSNGQVGSGNDTFIRVSQVVEAVAPLYSEFPYLKGAMDKLLIDAVTENEKGMDTNNSSKKLVRE